MSAALDCIDGCKVGTNIEGRKANHKVKDHVVGRVIGILIADLVRQDRQRTSFTVSKRDTRV